MSTVFVAGSMNIKRLDPKFVALLEKVVASEMEIVVGDADGADTSIQNFLHEAGASAVTVYCSGPQPRNNAGNWPVHSVLSDAKPGTRGF